MGAADRGEAEANEELLEEHEHLGPEARVQVAKLELMHIVDWEQAQEVDVALARCRKWRLTGYIEMLAIRASNGPWLLLRRGSGGP